jgi:hypothetical protein
MPITLANGTRPVANPTTPLTVELEIKPAIENDAGDFVLYPITLNNQTFRPPDFEVNNCSYSNSSTTVSTSGSGFANVRVGDQVKSIGSSTDFPATPVRFVTDKTNNNQITVNQAPSGSSSSSTLQFIPFSPTDLVLAYIKVNFQQSAQTLVMNISVLPVPGELVSDADRDGDTSDDIAVNSLTPIPNTISLSIDLDDYLTKARVARA